MQVKGRFCIVWALCLVMAGCGREESSSAAGGGRGEVRAVAVAVEPIVVGAVRDERIYTGTLLPSRRFTVAARTAGIVKRLDVQIGDRVERNQVVGELESDELREELVQAQADLQVARANLQLAISELELTQREWSRIQSLRDRDFASVAERDRVESLLSSRQAGQSVAESTVLQREAALRRAEIRLEYATLRASWEGSDAERFVSRRFLDEGSLAANNSPIIEVVSLDPLIGQFYVPEADYYRIEVGMPVKIQTGGHGGRSFAGKVRSIAPEFSIETRRALVEVTAANAGHMLAPGVFMRTHLVLGAEAEAVLVPITAIVRRSDREGIFIVDEAEGRARFYPIERGFQEGNQVAVSGIEGSGWAVVLGHDQLTDGTPVQWFPSTGQRGSGGSERGARTGGPRQ
jgi:RND family efflux transporter MFP subunit